MRKIFFKPKYRLLGAFVRIPLFTGLGFVVGTLIGLLSVPTALDDHEYTRALAAYLALGIAVGCVAGIANEVRLAYRPR